MKARTILPVLVLFSASPGSADALHLSCEGSGNATDSDYVRTETRSSDGRTKQSSTLVDNLKSFSGEVKVEIVDGAGRAYLPRAFLPALTRGKDGWFDLKNLSETDKAVTAKIAVGMMNRPNLQIDRLTGSIAVDGSMGNFAGHCRPYDPATSKRAF
ncbi:hypothetical protein [Polymorphobacter fuscus]|uniref:Uncharacterized protein n=1 Tax=Sandarakinorhabdus fusca TaxID=1439888 RepID=A0A7C9LH59_9SPHN|nr:hypothetical protein [Polymorphobacter fuscus]KAB7645563.1 hypothetical protein F9290_12145 [Polymorphobacter fuscus]MQT18007.1 hypothetical protein [Polymorphobacter fuscus]NJC08636.1 hypothetical protein [Polymorphobacter fuscus]